MYFSKEFLAGAAFACVGLAGMAFLLSRRNNPTTNECEPKNIEEDLEDDTDVFEDAETGGIRSTRNDNLNKTTQSKSIEELFTDTDAFREMQHNLELCKMKCVALEHKADDIFYTTQQTVDEQLSDVKTELNRLIGTVGLLQTAATTTAERITKEKPDGCNFGRVKTCVSNLEREVSKNSEEITKTHPYRALTMMEIMELESGSGSAAAAMSAAAAENRFERTLNLSNAQTANPPRRLHRQDHRPPPVPRGHRLHHPR